MTEPPEDHSHAHVGIVAALWREIRPLVQRCSRVRKTMGQGLVVHGGWLGDRRIALLEAGIGKRQVLRATAAFLEGHTPDLLIVAGFAGALSPTLRLSEIVVANEVVGPEGGAILVPVIPNAGGAGTAAGLAARVGRLLTVDQIVRTVKQKRDLHDRTGALAVDMETLHIARLCQDRGVRFGVVRVVSDDAHTDLPAEVLSIFGTSKYFRLGVAVGAAWKRPGSVNDLWQLRQRAHSAAEVLAEWLQRAIACLG